MYFFQDKHDVWASVKRSTSNRYNKNPVVIGDAFMILLRVRPRGNMINYDEHAL